MREGLSNVSSFNHRSPSAGHKPCPMGWEFKLKSFLSDYEMCGNTIIGCCSTHRSVRNYIIVVSNIQCSAE